MAADVIEPLEMLASVAWDAAPHLCSPEHGCKDYHQVWSYLRLLGIISATTAGGDFFVQEFARLAGEGKKRVLISGAADAGTLALVSTGFRRAGVAPEIVFLDRCQTPVEQNRALAKQLGINCEFICEDIRTLNCAPVDAICTHSFLFFFDRVGRCELFRSWARNLKPGGLVITSNRIGVTAQDSSAAMSEQERTSRVTQLRKAAEDFGGNVADRKEEMGEAAGRMWMAPGHIQITEAEIREAAADAGLEVEKFAFQSNAPNQKSSYSSARLNNPRAEIILRRPF